MATLTLTPGAKTALHVGADAVHVGPKDENSGPLIFAPGGTPNSSQAGSGQPAPGRPDPGQPDSGQAGSSQGSSASTDEDWVRPRSKIDIGFTFALPAFAENNGMERAAYFTSFEALGKAGQDGLIKSPDGQKVLARVGVSGPIPMTRIQQTLQHFTDDTHLIVSIEHSDVG